MHIYKELAKEQIEIPFPQRDVWMRGGKSEGSEGEEVPQRET